MKCTTNKPAININEFRTLTLVDRIWQDEFLVFVGQADKRECFTQPREGAEKTSRCASQLCRRAVW